MAFATVCTLVGITVPVALDIPVPSGAAIILCAGALFLAAIALRMRRAQPTAL